MASLVRNLLDRRQEYEVIRDVAVGRFQLDSGTELPSTNTSDLP